MREIRVGVEDCMKFVSKKTEMDCGSSENQGHVSIACLTVRMARMREREGEREGEIISSTGSYSLNRFVANRV